MGNESRKTNILGGYCHLIREAIRSRADNIRDQLYPEYCMIVQGIIVSNNNVRLILNEMNTQLHTSVVRDNFYFSSAICTKNVSDNVVICNECEQEVCYLQRKCVDAVKMRTEGISNDKTNNKFLCNSPSLLSHKVDRLAQSAKYETKKRSKAKAKVILKMVTEKEGISLSGANLEEVFPSNLQDLADKYFDKEKITQDNLARYLFRESFIQARTAIKSGNRACRYSPVMIRFCIGIRDKLKKGKYKFVRKVFNLPSARILSHYDSIGGNEPDGVLYTVIQSIQRQGRII